jgi:hypothetical protein
MSRLPAPSQQWTERLQHRNPTVICPACFWIGTPRLCLRGSFFIERVLWGLGLATLGIMPLVGELCAGLGCLPGLLYSVWRRSRRSSVCPQCGTNQLVSEEDAYPPACSHFLFSTERSRESDRTQSWPTVAQETAVHSSMSAIGVASQAGRTQNVRDSEQKPEECA